MFKELSKNRLLMVWLAFFTSMVFFGGIILPGTMSADSNLIQNIADGVVEPGEGSFAATAFFFKLFPSPLDIVLILCVGWFSLSLFMQKLKTPQANLMAWYMTVPAILTCLVRPQKETIVVILACVITWIVTQTSLSKLAKVALVVVVYAIYAALFRTYFFLIIAAFAGVYFMVESRRALIYLLVSVIAVLVVFLIPLDILYKLQYPRDIVNYNRVGSGVAGHRTAFFNPYPIDSAGNFLLNYGYTFVRMNIPMVFDLSAKAWFWFGSVACYVFVIISGLRKSSDEIRILVSLFLSHVAVLMLFEPDTGSYTRHITSVFVYMLPAMLVVDEFFQKMRKPKPEPITTA